MLDINLIINSLWIFLPAAIANMTASLSRFLPLPKYPLDFNLKYKGKRIFGENKTFRGLIIGSILAGLGAMALNNIYSIGFSSFNYSGNLFVLGVVLGFGALIGDAVESFFKRQAKIPPGKSWIPFDQIDWIIGAYITSYLILNIPLTSFLITLIIFGTLHPLINYFGYSLKLQKNKL
ncbi:MAG: hypothetical protein CXT77_04330 [uncultured DHVE6 group euryarchaeote]|nr:MAG: hypothetical protein CXT77_04330 [uncultured DHVE6 group euryarchaeote]